MQNIEKLNQFIAVINSNSIGPQIDYDAQTAGKVMGYRIYKKEGSCVGNYLSPRWPLRDIVIWLDGYHELSYAIDWEKEKA